MRLKGIQIKNKHFLKIKKSLCTGLIEDFTLMKTWTSITVTKKLQRVPRPGEYFPLRTSSPMSLVYHFLDVRSAS